MKISEKVGVFKFENTNGTPGAHLKLFFWLVRFFSVEIQSEWKTLPQIFR